MLWVRPLNAVTRWHFLWRLQVHKLLPAHAALSTIAMHLATGRYPHRLRPQTDRQSHGLPVCKRCESGPGVALTATSSTRSSIRVGAPNFNLANTRRDSCIGVESRSSKRQCCSGSTRCARMATPGAPAGSSTGAPTQRRWRTTPAASRTATDGAQISRRQ